MSNLPYDYSRCDNVNCELKSRCSRHLSPGREGAAGQSFSAFPGGKGCDAFIDHFKERSSE